MRLTKNLTSQRLGQPTIQPSFLPANQPMRANATEHVVLSAFITLAMVLVGCGGKFHKNHDAKLAAPAADPLSESSATSESLIGTWQNDTCTPVQWEPTKGADGHSNPSSKLWYHETLLITANTLDSVNTYFRDDACTELDSYQPSASEGGLLSYRLGLKISPNVDQIDFNSLVGTAPVYTVISLDQNQLSFGDASDQSQDGKSAQTRLTKIGSRIFKKILK